MSQVWAKYICILWLCLFGRIKVYQCHWSRCDHLLLSLYIYKRNIITFSYEILLSQCVSCMNETRSTRLCLSSAVFHTNPSKDLPSMISFYRKTETERERSNSSTFNWSTTDQPGNDDAAGYWEIYLEPTVMSPGKNEVRVNFRCHLSTDLIILLFAVLALDGAFIDGFLLLRQCDCFRFVRSFIGAVVVVVGAAFNLRRLCHSCWRGCLNNAPAQGTHPGGSYSWTYLMRISKRFQRCRWRVCKIEKHRDIYILRHNGQTEFELEWIGN